MPSTTADPQAEQLANFIKTVPVFHSLEDDHVQRLANELEVRNIPTGEVLLTRGEVGNEMFIMLMGEAAAYVSENNVQFERELKRFYPGSYFGMTHILTRDLSPTTVRTVVDSKAIVITRETIERLFADSPTFAHAVCRSLASYLSENIIRVPTVPFKRLEDFPNLETTARMLPSRISRHLQAVAVEHLDDRVVVAIVNPSNRRACDFIGDILNEFTVEFVAISADDFERYAQKRLVQHSDVVADQKFEEFSFVNASGQLSPVRDNAGDDLSRALTHSIRTGASDIHLEPAEKGGRIRIRLDGKMMPFGELTSTNSLKHMISALKVAAGLDITNTRRPQDGRFKVVADGRTIDFRVSIMPCDGGEKLVLRMSDQGNYVSFDGLFVSDAVSHFARDIFAQPSGLVLVTGPTGSGKTTSLYAALKMIHRENSAANVVTVEDPVEYALDFATQSQVDEHNSLGFDKMLRSILRQDPDVMLIGEIRDRESAAIAVEAATTGHLVLSTLHTHSALETITRLRNLDIPPYLLADAVKGIVSQKLLPRIHGPSSVPVSEDDPVARRLIERGILDESSLSKLRRGRETEDGPAGGESGRIAMFEILSVSQAMSELIETGGTRAQIAANMTDDSFFSFEKYARLLLEAGHVAPEQVERLLPRVPRLV